MTAEGASAPAVGDLVFDEGAQRPGRVVAVWSTGLALRPIGGGVEWRASRDKVREPKASERLSPRVAEVNRQSAMRRRWGS